MTYEDAERKAEETGKLNNRPFKVVRVTYRNGEEGWDVTPVEERREDMTQLVKGTLAYKLAKMRGELPMKNFKVEILTNPPVWEIQMGISQVERKTVVIQGYSLSDAKKRAGIS